MLKARYILTLILILSLSLGTSNLVAQNNNIRFVQSNPDLDFDQFMNGLKYAYIELEERDQQQIDEQGSILLNHFADYLRDLGFQFVAMTTDEKQKLLASTSSLCDIAKVKLEITVVKNAFTKHMIRFSSCLNDSFQFFSPTTLHNDEHLLTNLYNLWVDMYNKRIQYDESITLQMPLNLTDWTEATLKQYYSTKQTDKLEGVYEKMLVSSNDELRYQIALKKDISGNYDAIYLNGASNYRDWKAGEVLGKIVVTGTNNFYKVSWYRPDKTLAEDGYLTIQRNNMLYMVFASDEKTAHKYFKLYPKNAIADLKVKATGSGVIISRNGFVITNYHVVEGGQYLEVEVKRNGYRQVYNAVLVVKDPINDLAILKIDDMSFEEFSPLPYTFRTSVSEVGEKVFAFGFPLIKTMGEDVKVTDGIINSKTGYEGDVSTYQVSVTVQPGSSGGPLFDSNGNLIGIIKAKHSKAVNVTYAIKTRNLLNLIELLPERLILPQDNRLLNLPLEQQIKLLENYVSLVRVLE